MDISNLQYLTVSQIERELFAPKEDKNFLQEVADYMADTTNTQAQQTKDMSETLKLQTKVQNGFTDITEAAAQQVQKAYAEAAAAQPSSEPKWLQITQQVVMAAAAALSGDFMMLGLMIVNSVMQDVTVNGSSLQDQMTTKVAGNNSWARFGFEAGVAIGEAAVCGGISSSVEGSAPEDVQEADEAAANKPSQGARFRGHTIAYAGQTLMQNNAWVDFLEGCGASQETAVLVGMFVGMAVAAGASFASPDSALQEMGKGRMKAGLAKMGIRDTEGAIRQFNFALRIASNTLQIYSAGLQFQIGEQYQELAKIQKDVLAPATARLALYQGLTNAMTPIITATQGALRSISQDAAAENQTFLALGNLFKQVG